MPLSSVLQRRFRTKVLFLTAVTAVAAGAVIAMCAPVFPVLLAGRLLQGVGTGIITPLMFTIILTRAPRTKLGALMGVGGLTLGVAPAVGPLVGGIIGQITSWRAVFAIILPFVLASLVVGVRSIEQAAPTEKVSANLGHVTLLAVGFIGLILGLERGGALLAAGTASTADVAPPSGCSSRASSPASSSSSSSAAATTRSSTCRCSTRRSTARACSRSAPSSSWPSAWAPHPEPPQLALGTGTMTAGLLVLPGAAIGAVLAPVAGNLYDRFGPAVPITIGCTVALAATVGLAVIGTGLTAALMAGLYFAFMLGFGLTYMNTQTLGMSGVERSLTADGTALMNTCQQFLGAMSMTVLSTVLAMHQAGTEQGSAAFADASARGGAVCFLIIAAVVAIAFVAERLAICASARRAAEAAAADAELGVYASVTRLLDEPLDADAVPSRD